MPRFPLEYGVELHKNDGEPMELSSGNRPRLITGPPFELGGSDAWWSPEHLLVSAVASCMSATFFALATRAKIHVGAYRCRANGVIDRIDGHVAFTSVHLAIDVRALADDVQRTRNVIEEAKKHCFVATSLRCPVDIVANVTAS
jgi:organic hydroperoxide reductase OsmC/OhrA